MSRPMGIMASFSNVSFKKDGAEIFTTRVTSGGCLGHDDVVVVINRGYDQLKKAIDEGKLTTAALEFNQVSVGAHNFKVRASHAVDKIKKSDIKAVKP